MERWIVLLSSNIILDGLLTNFLVYKPGSEIFDDIKNISTYSGTVDLWLFWFSRSILVILWIILFRCNIGTKVIKYANLTNDLCSIYYLAAKLLAYKEENVWATIGYSNISTLITYFRKSHNF